MGIEKLRLLLSRHLSADSYVVLVINSLYCGAACSEGGLGSFLWVGFGVESACMRYGPGALPLAGVVAVTARRLLADRPASCFR